MNLLRYINYVIEGLGNLLTASVTVAILLFLIGQIITIIQKTRTQNRAKKALKMILSEEIERNYYVLNNLFSALSLVRKEVENSAEIVTCKLYISRSGQHNIRCCHKDGSLLSGNTLLPFVTNRYEKLIDRIAEFDRTMFKQLQNCYSTIGELDHWRELLLDYLTEEMEEFPGKNRTGEFLSNLSRQKDDYYNILNATYEKLGNSKLESTRLF